MRFAELEDKQEEARCAIAEIALDCEAKTCALDDINALCKTANRDNWQSVIERIQDLIYRNQ